MVEKTEPKKKRAHKATFARDKRKGGYLIRVEGPAANRFANKEVPVTLKNGEERLETLENVIWSGKDKETGNPRIYTRNDGTSGTSYEVFARNVQFLTPRSGTTEEFGGEDSGEMSDEDIPF